MRKQYLRKEKAKDECVFFNSGNHSKSCQSAQSHKKHSNNMLTYDFISPTSKANNYNHLDVN